MLEKKIEANVCQYARDKGFITRKWTSPGHAFVPDQIFLNYVPPEHREIVAKYIIFVEMKREDGICTPGQLREHRRLRDHGFRVEVVNSIDRGKEIVDGHI